jgi:hypothetical protein
MNAGPRTEMVSLPAGLVTLSDRRTERVWPVELSAYQLSAFPVTRGQYLQVTGERPDGCCAAAAGLTSTGAAAPPCAGAATPTWRSTT